MSKVKNFIATIFDYDKFIKEWVPGDDQKIISENALKWSAIEFLGYQIELCPSTNKKHAQVVCQLKYANTIDWIQSYILCSKSHISKITVENGAEDYWCKEETRIEGPWSMGTYKKAQQGKRNDIIKAVNMIKEGKRNIDLVNECPETFVKYHKGLEKVQHVLLKEQSKKLRDVKVHVIWGAAGTGKSHTVYDITNGFEDCYKLSNNADQIWFNGYEGEKTLWIEEFYGWIKLGYFLELIDKYPVQLNVKGSHSYALWSTIYITTNIEPKEWYKNCDKKHQEAIARRFTSVKQLKFEIPTACSDVEEAPIILEEPLSKNLIKMFSALRS